VSHVTASLLSVFMLSKQSNYLKTHVSLQLNS
jgi:hypothetical protein